MPASDDTLLMVRIEAQISKFERAMAKASGTATSTARKIETDFRRMDRNLSSIGGGFVRGLLAPLAALASARGLGQAVNAFTRIENALKIAGLQGEELTGVFEKLTDIATRNGAPIEALSQLYSRLALVQKELGVSSSEIVEFTNGVAAALRVSGRSAEESRGALLQLSQALGSGIVRAEEFNAILEGALPIAQAAARGLVEAGGSVAKLRKLIIDGKVSSEAFFRAFQVGQPALEALAETADITLSQAFTNLQSELVVSIGRLDEFAGISEALIGVMNRLGPAIGSVVGFVESLSTTPPPSWFRDFLINGVQIGGGPPSVETNPLFSADVEAAVEQVEALDAVEAAKERLKKSGAVQTSDIIQTLSPEQAKETEAIAARIQQAMEDAGLARKPVTLKDFPIDPSGAKKTPEQKFGDDIARIRERTLALEADTAAVGKSTLAAEKLRAVQDLLNQAKRAGVRITPELTAQIDKEAEAYARAAATLEEVQQQHQELLDLQNFVGESLTDTFTDIVTGAATVEESLKRVVSQLVQAALQAALLGKGPLAVLFGGGPTGGGPGGLFGKLFGGSFAGGGTLGAGKWGIAGERGPEMIRGPASITPMGRPQQQTHRFIVETIPNPLFSTVIRQEVDAGGRRTLAQVSGHLAEQQRAY